MGLLLAAGQRNASIQRVSRKYMIEEGDVGVGIWSVRRAISGISRVSPNPSPWSITVKSAVVISGFCVGDTGAWSSPNMIGSKLGVNVGIGRIGES